MTKVGRNSFCPDLDDCLLQDQAMTLAESPSSSILHSHFSKYFTHKRILRSSTANGEKQLNSYWKKFC